MSFVRLESVCQRKGWPRQSEKVVSVGGESVLVKMKESVLIGTGQWRRDGSLLIGMGE